MASKLAHPKATEEIFPTNYNAWCLISSAQNLNESSVSENRGAKIHISNHHVSLIWVNAAFMKCGRLHPKTNLSSVASFDFNCQAVKHSETKL